MTDKETYAAWCARYPNPSVGTATFKKATTHINDTKQGELF